MEKDVQMFFCLVSRKLLYDMVDANKGKVEVKQEFERAKFTTRACSFAVSKCKP